MRAEWAIEEFGGADLGDQRRTNRLVEVASVLGERPEASLPAACADAAQLKATYRLLENAAVAPAAMLASHVQQTLERLVDEPVVLAVQDTTEVDYSSHPATQGLGPIGNGHGTGLLVHSTVAVTPAGVPAGLLAQEEWVRDAAQQGQKLQRKPLPIGEKESHKWLTSLAMVNGLAEQCPQTQFVSMADREADIIDLFCARRAANVALLVRANYDRRVETADAQVLHVRASLATAPVGCTRHVPVSRRDGWPARTALVQLRWQALTLRVPAHRADEAALAPVPLWVLWAHEADPPAGEAALDWLLLTTLPLPDQTAALQVLGYYTCRWVIERWHFVLKSGCALEARQLESQAALQRALVLFSVIAWKVLATTLLARTSPELPCTVLLAPEEWQALYCTSKKTTTLPAVPPTLAQAVRWIAQLGGFLGRTSDGEPGSMVLWRGFQRLADRTAMFVLLTAPPAHHRTR